MPSPCVSKNFGRRRRMTLGKGGRSRPKCAADRRPTITMHAACQLKRPFQRTGPITQQPQASLSRSARCPPAITLIRNLKPLTWWHPNAAFGCSAKDREHFCGRCLTGRLLVSSVNWGGRTASFGRVPCPVIEQAALFCGPQSRRRSARNVARHGYDVAISATILLLIGSPIIARAATIEEVARCRAIQINKERWDCFKALKAPNWTTRTRSVS
jgi:hypothetical protein